MFFSRKRENCSYSYSLNGKSIASVPELGDLGVNFDTALSFGCAMSPRLSLTHFDYLEL